MDYPVSKCTTCNMPLNGNERFFTTLLLHFFEPNKHVNVISGTYYAWYKKTERMILLKYDKRKDCWYDSIGAPYRTPNAVAVFKYPVVPKEFRV